MEKRCRWAAWLLVGALISACAVARAEPPLARVTSGEIVIAAAATNGTDVAWLDTGGEVAVLGADGLVKTGAGAVRAIMYTVPSGGVTNWVANFYAFDGGVKRTLYSASSTTALPTSGRYDLISTNLVFSGRIRVEVFHNYANASAATRWKWAAIVE